MVDEVRAEDRPQMLLGDGHPHPGAESLAQRPGGHLDPQRRVPLGVARGGRPPLAESSQVVHGDGKPAQMEQRVEQHRAVTVGEHEAIAVDPGRGVGIDPEELGPHHDGDVGHAHGHAGMARVGFLDGVHRQALDGVDGELFDVLGHLILAVLAAPA